MKTVDLKLYGEQTTVFGDWLNTDKNVIDIIPVGSGKTFLSSWFLPIAASTLKYNKGRDVVYFAPTREMCKTLIWENLKSVCKEYFNIPDEAINASDLTIKFPNNIFIRLKSAEARENLRGMNIGVAILDEAALFHQESLLEISNRIRPAVGSSDSWGRMIVISTPNGQNALYNLYQSAQQLPEKWITRLYTWEQMRVADRQFVAQQRQILSPLKFEKDWNCSWGSVEDKFFMSWNRAMCGDVDDNWSGDLYTFHDFNAKMMCAIVAKVTNPGKLDGKVEVLNTYAIPNCNTEQLAQAIRRDYMHRNIYAIIDASGGHANRSTTSPFGVTDRTLLEKYGFRIINNIKSNPLIKDTDNSSNAFIARGGLVVKPTDVNMLKALDNYHYETPDRIKLVKYDDPQLSVIDSLGDALRYGLNFLFPVQHIAPNTPQYVTDSNRGITVPGAEYMKQSPLFPGGPTLEEILKPNHGFETEDSVSW